MLRRILLGLAAVPLVVFALASGCSAQGEGQLCDTLNNTSDDCQAGLICTQKNGYKACCPPSGSTNPACTGVGGTGGTATTTTTSTTSTTTTSTTTTTSSTTTSTTTTTTTDDGGTDGGDGG